VTTGADGSADQGARRGWRWDVALSFAGAQRAYVEQVAGELKASGVRCFYDADEQIDLWGKFLAEELPAIYGEQAAAVVMFVSAEYADRDWTRPERRSALARAVRERREYVLPARFDDTPLPGLPPDMVWVDLRGRTPSQFAAMIAAKLNALSITAASAPVAQEFAGVSATVLADPVAAPRARVQRGGPLFIDREEQRVRLGETLQDDVSPIIVVTGQAGVGKTRLVDEVLAGLGWDTAETTGRRVCRHDAAPGSRLDMKALIDDVEHGAAPANLYLYGPASRARMQVALDGYKGTPVVIIVESAEYLLDDAQSLHDPDLDEALEMLSARSRSPVKVVLVSQEVPQADGAITWPATAHSIFLSGLAVTDFRRFFDKLDPAAECGLATLAPARFEQVHSRLRGNPRLAELLHALISWADRDLGAEDVPAWLAAGTEEEVPQRLTDMLVWPRSAPPLASLRLVRSSSRPCPASGSAKRCALWRSGGSSG
jgi:hypothetical protein